MSTLETPCSAAVDQLPSAALAEIRRRWVAPTPSARDYQVPAEQVDLVAKLALDAMLVRQFRVTPFPPAEEYDQLLSRARHWVRRGKPIRIMLGYGPLKNPKTVSHATADWAEFFAFCNLCAWHNKVCSVYPPGLQIKIIFDDSTIRMANRYALAPMRDYIRSVGRLIATMGYQELIVGTMKQSSFAWLFHFGLYQLARRRVRRWEQDPQNAETVEQMLEFSRRNLALPDEMSDAQQERCYEQAAHRYRVYWEALQMSGLSRIGNKLVAMYLAGNQHHLRQEAALHLTSVAKGQVTQPWQGEGALHDNGHGKLVPIVLTAKKQQELSVREIDLQGVVQQEGLASILVCHNQK